MPHTSSSAREASIQWSATAEAPTSAVPLSNGAAAYGYLLEFAALRDPREHFYVIALDTRRKPVGYYLLSIGSANQCLVHPADVFRFALLSCAVSIILAHTHPSGDVVPSIDDEMLTARIAAAGHLLGIPVDDHIVLGCNTDKFTSLRSTSPQFFRS